MLDRGVRLTRPAPEDAADVPVARDRLLQKAERIGEPCSRREDHCISAQVKVVGSEIVRRTTGRTYSFGGLQCWFDDAGDADRDLVLKLEDILQGPIKVVRPE